MAISDELARLHQLHQTGALSDEEFARAKAHLLDTGERAAREPGLPGLAAVSSLRRSRKDRWIAGVCGGLADATGADSWVWRLVFAALLVWGGAGLLFYAMLWIFVPEE